MNDRDPDDDPTPPRDTAPLPLQAPGPDHPAHAALWLLERCRERGFRVGPYLEMGGIRMQVRDLRQDKIEGFAGGSDADEMPDDFKMVLGKQD
jgi:hypothetical protein